MMDDVLKNRYKVDWKQYGYSSKSNKVDWKQYFYSSKSITYN